MSPPPSASVKPEAKPSRASALAARFETLAAELVKRSSGAGLGDKARRLWRNRPGLERIFGAGLAVWVGGAALAMAGYFLVTYSIELGLMTPAVRMVFGGAFGLALLAGSEVVHRRQNMADRRRIAQALAGAGIADLYAMLYIATTVYGLMPPVAGFLGLAATTAAALILALRLGLPTAVLGLVGGFATPAMVGASEPNIPVLLAYLFLVIGGLHLLIRHRGWWWLGIPATLGGFGWVGMLLASDAATQHSTSLGIFLIGMAGMAFATGGHRKSMPLGQVLRDARTLTPLITGGIALAQLAIVVGSADFGWMDWGLFGLLAAACIAMGLRDDNSIMLPPIALIVSIGLFGLAPARSDFQVSVVAIVAIALFAASGYWQTWRGRRPLLWLGQAVAASITFFGIAFVKLREAPYQFGAEPQWAAVALLLALPAAGAAYILLRRRVSSEESDDRPAMLAGGAASAFAAVALLLATPGDWLPLAFAVQAAATMLAARRLRTPFINWYNIAVGALFLAALATVPVAAPLDAIRRLFIAGASEPAAASLFETFVVYGLPAVAMAVIAGLATLAAHRRVAGWVTTALIALGLSSCMPGMLLPLAYSLQALATVVIANRRRAAGLYAHAVAVGSLLAVAVLAVPDATPLDALYRLFAAHAAEPAAAALLDTILVYWLPAAALAMLAMISTRPLHRVAAGWAATALLSIGLAASVPAMQLPIAYAVQALVTVAVARRTAADWLAMHGIAPGLLMAVAIAGVPDATPVDALTRLFLASKTEPAAAGIIDTVWVYGLPAAAMAAIAWLSGHSRLRAAAGWMATGLVSTGLAASVPGLQLPLAYALQALATVAIAGWLRDSRMGSLAIPAGVLLPIAVLTVPTATPLDAVLRLFTGGESEPLAAEVIHALWVYGLPALAMAAIAWISTGTNQRFAAGWMATALIAFGLAASVPGLQLPLAYALQILGTLAIASRWRGEMLKFHVLPLGLLLGVAVLAVPDATPLDALSRLFTATAGPAAAGFIETLWVYLLPAMALAAAAWITPVAAYRAAAAWLVTGLVSTGLAAIVPGMQLPLAYALQALGTLAIASRWRGAMLRLHGAPLGVLLGIAVLAVPEATPLDAVQRLFAPTAEPAAAGFVDTLWVYLLPATALAAVAWFTPVAGYRLAAAWSATILVSTGLAASVPGMQLPLAYALQALVTLAIASRWRPAMLSVHALPLGVLLAIAVLAVPNATPLDAILRLFAATAEPAAAGIVDTFWVYLLPAAALAAGAWLTPLARYRIAIAWSVTVLVSVGLAASVPGTQLPLAYALQGLATLALASRLRVDIVDPHAVPVGVLFLVAFLTVPDTLPLTAFLQLVVPGTAAGQPIAAIDLLSVFVLPAMVAAASAWLTRSPMRRVILSATGVGLTTLACGAFVPADWLPMTIALLAMSLAYLARRLDGYGLRPLSVATVTIFVVQTVPIAIQIVAATLPSLVGVPVYADALPGFADFLRQVALPAIPIAAMARLLPTEHWLVVRRAAMAFAAIAALVLPYVAIKALFGIDDPAAFQSRGFFERTLLTQICFAAGLLALEISRRKDIRLLAHAGLGLTAIAFARLVWFDLLVFNPMLVAQQVGSLPLFNGLLIGYGLPILWLSVHLRTPDSLPKPAMLAVRSAIFALVVLLVGYQVRQFFQGSLLIPGAVGTAELYGYSVAALATGIGFLVWGTARQDRPARMISLALVLAAVAKVFLYDASELTGLWRVAAFAGLGFSLLGISWFYTRYVFVDRNAPSDPTEPQAEQIG